MIKVKFRKFIKERKTLSFLIIMVAAFAIWNLVWFSTITITYDKYTKVVPKNWADVHVMTKDEGFMYSVSKPGYLSFTGNLVIKNTKTNEALFIWPKIFDGNYKFGLKYIENDIAERVYIERNGKVTNKLAEKYGYGLDVINSVENRQEEIQDYFNRANEMWGIK